MGKFLKNLMASESEIIKRRAEMLNKAAAKESKRIIENLDEQIDKIKIELEVMNDLNPANKYSMVFGEEFDPVQWATRRAKLLEDMVIMQARLEILKKDWDENFKD